MKKKKPVAKSNLQYFENERALRELAHFKHRELQRACIVRGLESQNIVDFDHHKLASWFVKNYDNSQNEDLLIAHDAWVEEQLIARGYKKGDVLLSPALRFSYVGNIEEMEKPKIIKPPIAKNPENITVVSPKKEKSTIDEKTGLRTGTKKSLTYQLTLENKEVAEVIKLVKDKFPEADEKSIKIWYKRALKTKE